MEAEKYDTTQAITPEEIKKIRLLLGLSQAKAGELLGGGPSAFAKYENGSVKPSVCLVKMLRFLQNRPEELAVMSGQESQMKKPEATPFSVTSAHVSELNPRDFSILIEKLLSAEALEWNLPLYGIHVAFEQTAPDGGEDARIKWQESHEFTSFLPNRFCLFQLKTGNISPDKAGKEVLTRQNKIKPRIRKALEEGGSYIMLCSRPYTQPAIERRVEKIIENLKEQNLAVAEHLIQFRDSNDIASWVNHHPSVAIWLLQKTQPGLIISSFGSWKHWSGRFEHLNSPWVEDPRLQDFRGKLRAIVETPKGVARVVGPSGIGKSRLTLEALGPTETENTSGVKLSDLVLYAVEPETDSLRIKEYAWNLVNTGKRVVLVVDSCSEETRVDLTNMVKHSNSLLSLVTISNEIPRNAEESEDTLVINYADYPLIEEIVRSINPNILEWDRRRIVESSGGNITYVQIIAEEWNKKGLIAIENEYSLIRKFLGHENQEEFAYTHKVAKLISTFDIVGIEAPYEEELEQIVSLGDNISVQGFRRVVSNLSRRRVLQRLGAFVMLQPKHIAINLAEEQWEEWSCEQWKEVLLGSLDEQLRIRAAKQLTFLNTRSIAVEVARCICGEKKFWSSLENLAHNSEILVLLAEIDPQSVVNLLEHVLDLLEQAQIEDIMGHTRHNLVNILTKIAFADNTFEDAAMLLFKLACGENENIINNATGQFKSLFPVILGTTEAGPEKRLRVIDDLRDMFSDSDSHLFIIVGALLEGAKTSAFHRDVGPEIHGSRPSLESWMPETTEEYWNYVKECVNRLIELTEKPGDTGELARRGVGHYWRKYVLDGLIEDVEKWTYRVKERHPYWPEALESFGILLQFHKNDLTPSVKEKLKTLVSALKPDSLDDRIQFFLMEMPYGYIEEDTSALDSYDLRCRELEQLVGELLDHEDQLRELIHKLCTGQHGMSQLFGRTLAEQVQDPLYWEGQIMEEFKSFSVGEQNFDFLIGYMWGIKKRNLKRFKEFKQEALQSPVFAPVLPGLTLRTGIGSEDVKMIIDALEADLISHEEITSWKYGKALHELKPEEVTPLFDLMLKRKSPLSFGVVLDLMISYTYRREELLEDLRPQLLLLAEYPSIEKEKAYDPSRARKYETLMGWIISKGNKDPDARTVAINITKQLITKDLPYDDEKMVVQLLPELLSNFAEIAWPMIGEGIKENELKTWRISMVLRDRPLLGDKPPPILSVPEDVLFGWCYANPEIGPAFLAVAVPLLKDRGQETVSEEFHPTIRRLLDEFGERDEVLKGLESNIHTFIWSGSRVEYFARYKEPLSSIKNHGKGAVRRWAKKMLKYVEQYLSET
ncbi:MAG: type II toxin-antitoxin system MqsA family antitoxin [Candidatus Dadabacteria bacterium]|nr:type II toxin-antitoxin system MqsA family antitoxin [Candidatus Dadabacteria bacterium]